MKRRWRILVWGALWLATSWLAGCAGSAIPSQALNSRPVLLADRLGTAQDLIPTEAEIAAAKTALGTKGFIGIVACNLSSEYHAAVPRAAQALAKREPSMWKRSPCLRATSPAAASSSAV